jgi:hypothetical protein
VGRRWGSSGTRLRNAIIVSIEGRVAMRITPLTHSLTIQVSVRQAIAQSCGPLVGWHVDVLESEWRSGAASEWGSEGVREWVDK